MGKPTNDAVQVIDIPLAYIEAIIRNRVGVSGGIEIFAADLQGENLRVVYLPSKQSKPLVSADVEFEGYVQVYRSPKGAVSLRIRDRIAIDFLLAITLGNKVQLRPFFHRLSIESPSLLANTTLSYARRVSVECNKDNVVSRIDIAGTEFLSKIEPGFYSYRIKNGIMVVDASKPRVDEQVDTSSDVIVPATAVTLEPIQERWVNRLKKWLRGVE